MPPLALLLVACSASAPEDSAAASPPAEPPPAAQLTTQGALDAIGAGTQHGLPDTVDLFQTYLGLMALGDSHCPGDPLQLIDTNFPNSGCTADSGVTYTGISMVLTEAELLPSSAEGMARLIGGDFTITDVEGRTLDFGGQVLWTGQVDGDRTSIAAQVQGTFAYPGGSPWLAAGASAVLNAYVEDDGEPLLRVSGGLGTEGVDLWFDDLVFEPGCDGPAGAIQVRDPSGAWWTLTFADTCDGCGTLAYPGEADLATCLDLAPFHDTTLAMLETWP